MRGARRAKRTRPIVSDPSRSRLAVLGSPIEHSKSPALHRAAYATLGLDWRYDVAEVGSGQLRAFLDGLDESWRGLSLTMPLKREVLPALGRRSALVDRLGVANTVLISPDGLSGFNTDLYGIAESFRAAGVAELGSVHVLGGGATAASVIAAVAELGADTVTVATRSPERAADLVELGAGLGVEVAAVASVEAPQEMPDAVVSTLPGGTPVETRFPDEVKRHAVLLDVAYSPWPSELATEWGAVGGIVISGLEMLVLQALAQVRIFVSGDETLPLERESEVLVAMRESVGLDP